MVNKQLIPDPTPEEIQERSAEIRERWSERTRWDRTIVKPASYTVPVYTINYDPTNPKGMFAESVQSAAVLGEYQFWCHCCERYRQDYEMTDGEGHKMCSECSERTEGVEDDSTMLEVGRDAERCRE